MGHMLCRVVLLLLLSFLHAHNAPPPAHAQVMNLAIQGFHLNNSELREYTHGLFAGIAKVQQLVDAAECAKDSGCVCCAWQALTFV